MAKALTQSEKQRYLVEKRCDRDHVAKLVSRKSYLHGARVIECAQNMVEMRKLLKTHQQLDQQRDKSLAKVHGEKHILQLQHRDLTDGGEESENMDRTFLASPGFRFRSNGDIRRPARFVLPKSSHIIRRNESKKEITNIPRGSPNVEETCRKEDTEEEQTTAGGGDAARKPEKTETQSCGIRKEIEKIERELEEIKNSKELRSINQRISLVRRSLTYLRAHANDLPKSNPTQAPIPAAEPALRDRRIKKDADTASAKLSKSRRVSVQKFSRKCSRASCVACEFRMKHQEVASRKGNTSAPLRVWKIAPSGIYVRSLQAVSSASLQVTGRKSSMNNKRLGNTMTSSKADKVVEKRLKSTGFSNKKLSSNHPGRSMFSSSAGVVKRANSPSLTVQATGLGHTCSAIETSYSVPAKNLTKRSVAEMKRSSADASSHSAKVSGSSENAYRLIMCKASISDAASLETLQKLVKKRSNPDADKNPPSKEGGKTFTRKVPPMKNMKKINECKSMEITGKVKKFLKTLPDATTSVASWRTSSGQITNAKQTSFSFDKKATSDSEMTWRQYREKQKDNTDRGASSTGSTTGVNQLVSVVGRGQNDGNIGEDLSNLKSCRYLRVATTQITVL